MDELLETCFPRLVPISRPASGYAGDGREGIISQKGTLARVARIQLSGTRHSRRACYTMSPMTTSKRVVRAGRRCDRG
jgi:hypothetical protein